MAGLGSVVDRPTAPYRVIDKTLMIEREGERERERERCIYGVGGGDAAEDAVQADGAAPRLALESRHRRRHARTGHQRRRTRHELEICTHKQTLSSSLHLPSHHQLKV